MDVRGRRAQTCLSGIVWGVRGTSLRFGGMLSHLIIEHTFDFVKQLSEAEDRNRSAGVVGVAYESEAGSAGWRTHLFLHA